MRKFPKLKYPSDPETDGVLDGEVVVTEKLDGANFRWAYDEDGLSVGTRNVVYEDPNDPNVPKAFRHAIEYVRDEMPEWAVEEHIHAAESRDEGLSWTFFGEAMHKHSLVYSDVEYENPATGSPHFGAGYPNVVLFDIWDPEEGRWFTWDEVEGAAEKLGLVHADVLARGDGQELKDAGELEVPEESMFGGMPEGIVVRRVDGSVRAKKVTDDFKEQNAQAFDDPSKAQSDASEFVAAFITQPRIEKTVDKLVDRGLYEQPEMPMMEDLPREVIKDAFAEEGWNIICNEYGFEATWDEDFKDEVRSKASKKCARVLKQKVNSF